MGLLPLFFETSAGILVKTLEFLEPFQIGALYQENNLAIEFRAVRRISAVTFPPFQLINLTGYSLTISVGTAGTPFASQNTWTLNGSADTLAGSIDLNVAGLNALADGSRVIFEAILSNTTSKHTVQQDVVFRKAVMTSGSVGQAVLDVALGKQEAIATYAPKKGNTVQTWIDRNTGQEFMIYWVDGSFRSEPIT